MDSHHILNGLVSLVAACVLSYVVLSPRWNEGVVTKAGLIVMIFSLLATAALTLTGRPDWPALWNAGTALRCGIVLVVVGHWLRGRAKRHPLRRSTDWGEFDDRPQWRPWR